MKIVVGNNFDDIVLDESKDVLLEVINQPRNKQIMDWILYLYVLSLNPI